MELEYRSQKWFAGDAPVNYEKASAQIGAGTNGTVTVIKDTFDVDADDYSIEVVIPEEASDLSATLEDKKITVSLATVEAESASATIGAGTNGAVTVVVDEPGEDGNDFTIAVVEGFDGGTLGAGLNFETDIVVALGMTTASKAFTTIGSGDDGVVTVEVDTAGDAGNDYTIEVVNGTDGGSLAAALDTKDLLITLGMTTASKASTTIGSGEHGTVNIEYDQAGAHGNNVTVEVIEGTDGGALDADLNGNDITVALAMTQSSNAIATIGSGEHGAVNLTADATGAAGNSYTVEVKLASGNDAPLSVAFADGDLVVTLGTDGTGNNDPVKNTALLVASAIEANTDITAVKTGNGTSSLAVEAVKNFSGGTDSEPDNAANTATLVAAKINSINGITSTASGNGSTPITGAIVKKNLSGGTASAPDNAKNTATLIAGIVNSQAGSTFTATASGTGGTAISAAVTKKSFDGGADTAPDNAQNTATLIAAAINELDGFTATASGSGVTPITGAIAEAEFTGGSDVALNGSANTATLVAAEISEIDGFVATASGNGTTALSTETEEDVDFADGAYGTPCPQAGVTLYIGGYYYVSTKADNTVCNDGWRRFTLASY